MIFGINNQFTPSIKTLNEFYLFDNLDSISLLFAVKKGKINAWKILAAIRNY